MLEKWRAMLHFEQLFYCGTVNWVTKLSNFIIKLFLSKDS